MGTSCPHRIPAGSHQTPTAYFVDCSCMNGLPAALCVSLQLLHWVTHCHCVIHVAVGTSWKVFSSRYLQSEAMVQWSTEPSVAVFYQLQLHTLAYYHCRSSSLLLLWIDLSLSISLPLRNLFPLSFFSSPSPFTSPPFPSFLPPSSTHSSLPWLHHPQLNQEDREEAPVLLAIGPQGDGDSDSNSEREFRDEKAVRPKLDDWGQELVTDDEMLDS